MTRASAAVTTTATARANPPAAASALLQRKCACGNQAGFDGECQDCRDDKLRRKPREGGRLGGRRAPPIVHDVLRQPGEPLDRGTRAFMEARFDRSFADVRIHADPQAARSAAAVDAHAYTVGRHIVFAEGRHEPQTSRGRKLLAHELSHAAANSAGAVPRNLTLAEATGTAAEAEAERAEGLAHGGAPAATASGGAPGSLQRKGRTAGGFFSNIWSYIRGIFTTPFSAKQLQEYLKLLDDSNDIAADFESQRKARLVVQEWKNNHAAYRLNGKLTALLIREMTEGGAGKDDQGRILDLLEGATADELRFIFGPGKVTHVSLIQAFDAERPRLTAFYRGRYKVQKLEDMLANPALPDDAAKPADQPASAEAADRDKAVQQHAQQQQQVIDLLKQYEEIPRGYSAEDRLFQNSLEWISGKKLEMTILTATHDTDKRQDKKFAYFDSRFKHPDIGGTYELAPPADAATGQTGSAATNAADPRDAGIVYVDSRTTLGQATSVRVDDKPRLVSPSIRLFFDRDQKISLTRLSSTIVHEVQHVADQVGGDHVLTSDNRTELDRTWAKYQTEFRAYWIEPRLAVRECATFPGGSTFCRDPAARSPDALVIGTPTTQDGLPNFGSAERKATPRILSGEDIADKSACKECSGGPAGKKVETNLKNERQQKIFEHLLQTYPRDRFDCWYLCSKDFRDRVNTFAGQPSGPTGENLINSLRIDALIDAVDACSPDLVPKNAKIDAVMASADALDAADKGFMRDDKASAPLWERFKLHLAPAQIAEIRQRIRK